MLANGPQIVVGEPRNDAELRISVAELLQRRSKAER